MSPDQEISAAVLLERVEALLGQDPIGQSAALCDLQKDLCILQIERKIEPLEKVFQAFGTAVGKQSKSNVAHGWHQS
tara:strand:+ start:3822 stop:4052 length:231 start_codon:yes stop_codon:yes gene_type:complete